MSLGLFCRNVSDVMCACTDIMDIGLNLEIWYQIIWGCFATAKACKEPWSAIKCYPCVMVIDHIHSFIQSFHRHVQNVTIPCCSQELLPFLSVMYFFLPPSSPTILPSSLTSSCHLFLGLPISLVVPRFIYNTLLGILFSSILSVHAQTNIIYLNLLSLLW